MIGSFGWFETLEQNTQDTLAVAKLCLEHTPHAAVRGNDMLSPADPQMQVAVNAPSSFHHHYAKAHHGIEHMTSLKSLTLCSVNACRKLSSPQHHHAHALV